MHAIGAAQHKKNSWTGYTFDPSLYPDPKAWLASMHDQGLLLAANLHDDVGIGPWEEKHAAVAKIMGEANASATIPFTTCGNKTYAYAVEDVVLQAIEGGRIGGDLPDGGFDAWWIDWQQGGDHGGCAGGAQNPTIWTNRLRSTDAKRRAVMAARRRHGDSNRRAAAEVGAVGRNMVLARWGGMGSHRYQVGFSGDVSTLSWENLAYQPYFSLTAANVGYGYWSHDVEGPSADLELYTRWVQWGALSGVMRMHERGMSGGGCADRQQAGAALSQCAIDLPWEAPTAHYEAMRDALALRAKLLPYIYTAARHAYDTGVGLIRPMYFDYPTSEMAYAVNASGAGISQYMFGDDMFAAPIVAPADNATAPVPWQTGVATKTVWIPPGGWCELPSGTCYLRGNWSVMKKFPLSEVPLYARAGAVVPSVPLVDGATVGAAAAQYTALVFDLFPGAAKGDTKVYEDDGATTAYLDGATFAWLSASYVKAGATLTFTATMDGAVNDTAVVPAARSITLRLRSAFPPASVTVNGRALAHGRPSKGAPSWHWCGVEMAVVITAGVLPTAAPVTIVVGGGDWEAEAAALDGVKGGVARALLAKAAFDDARVTVGAHKPAADRLKRLSSFGSSLHYLAPTATRDAFGKAVAGFRQALQDARAEVDGMDAKANPKRKAYAQALLEAQ